MARRIGAMLGLAAMLTGCGGGDGGSGVTTVPGSPTSSTPTPTPTPTPSQTTAGCSLRERQDWVAAQMREWYLFPETLPTSLDPTPYTTVSDYLDALTAIARSQGRDRYFTYLTSIAEENAYYASGSSAGFGIRLGLTSDNRLFSIESFEGGAGLAAGIDRGTEITGIGTTTANIQTVSAIIAAGGTAALTDALGPDTAGTTRVLHVADAAGTRTVSVTKTDFSLTPVSSRYGAQVINDAGHQVGYVNLRTFISTADPALRSAFASFKSAGITEVIVDLRYNGGGLIETAETLADLLGGNRATSDVVDYITFRPEKSSENTTRFFVPQTQSVAPTKIAFIGTGGTASASELVINAFTPYLHKNSGLIGSNTYGKPVGQIALDQSACDDRLRVIALAVQNGARNADYYDGLANTVEASCQAQDDIGYPLGDPRESSTRAALDFIEGKTCTPIATGQTTQSLTVQSSSVTSTRRELLSPARPSTPQREVPGLF